MIENKHQIRSEKTSNMFIKALLEMLNEEDIQYITIRKLCGKLGLYPRSFYLYFDSKEDAILKCCLYMNNNEHSDIFQETSLPSQPLERIMTIFYRFYRLAVESPKLARSIYICKLKIYKEQFYSDDIQIYILVLKAVELCQKECILTNEISSAEITWDLINFSRGIEMDYFMRNESYDLLEVGMEKLKGYLKIYTL